MPFGHQNIVKNIFTNRNRSDMRYSERFIIFVIVFVCLRHLLVVKKNNIHSLQFGSNNSINNATKISYTMKTSEKSVLVLTEIYTLYNLLLGIKYIQYITYLSLQIQNLNNVKLVNEL